MNVSIRINRYMRSDLVRSRSEQTRMAYQYVLNHLKSWSNGYGLKTLDETLPDHLPAFCQHLKDQQVSDESVQHYLGIVKTMMRRTGCPIEYTHYVPAEARKKKQAKQLERWFDEDEVARMLAYDFKGYRTPQRNQLLVRLIFDTGARIDEIASIKTADIDLESRTIYLTTSKTVFRPVFISPETADMMRAIMLSGAWEGFPGTQQCKKIFLQMLYDLGLKNGNDGRGPHTARHYVATWLHYAGGMEIHDIARLLGDKPETIRDIYLHPTPKMLQRRVDAAMGWL